VIIPSIDLMDGHAVQLVGGKEKVLDAGDPRPLLERFRLAGEVAIIDLDAALGRGSNAELIRELVKMAPCRVGGGIRDVASAREWLDAGAAKVILGTAAVPEVLSQLPRDRVIAAVDAEDDEVVVHGWQTKTGRRIAERVAELKDYVGGFLITFVEHEGRLGGTDLGRIRDLIAVAGDARVTAAGGVTTTEDIAAIDRLGADAQVGMAIYTGKLDLGDAIAAPFRSDRPDGLWPTVVTDERGAALGLVYSDAASVREAVKTGRGVYHSRKRGLWVKGESSGQIQELLRVTPDCDRDALRFTVRQHGSGFCHTGTRSCWGDDAGLSKLLRLVEQRRQDAPAGSYTRRLFEDADLLGAKLVEEAGELAEATSPEDVTWEAADVLYFTACAMARAGVSMEQVEAELDRRALKLTRRKGDAKPAKT
jgi:phosphoribosylformimino-5-aminoimidazole carboxamide ribotide isomerase